MSDRIFTFSMETYEYVCTSFMETYAVANDVEFLVLFKWNSSTMNRTNSLLKQFSGQNGRDTRFPQFDWSDDASTAYFGEIHDSSRFY